MRTRSLRFSVVALALLLWSAPAFAQRSSAELSSATCPGTGCVVLGVTNLGSASVQLVGSGTWTALAEGSIDGSNFQTLSLSPSIGGASVTSATASGLWLANVGGMTQIRVRLSAYTSGIVVATIQGAPSGGGAGGSGGGGSSVSITQGGNTAAVNASSQLSITCANCTGSGVSQIDNTGFTPATSLFVPLGGELDDVGTTAITENSAGAARLTAQRALHANPRDAAGAEIFGTAAAAATGAANPTLGGLRTFPNVFNGTTWDRWTGAVTQSGTWNVGTVSTITNVVHVDDNAGSLTVDNGGTFAVQAAQSGTWTVQPGNTANTTAWLVAGARTNNTAAPGAVNFGALTAIANAANPSWTEGNLVGLSTDLAGALRVGGSISCSNCTGSGASAVDDAGFSVAVASVAPAGFLFDNVAPDSVDEGDVGLARMSQNRNAYVQIRDNAGNERGLNIDASGQIAVTLASAQTLSTVTTVGTITSLSQLGGVALPVEDAAETAAGVGIYAMSVRRDTAASSAGTTGDNATLNTDGVGALWVNPFSQTQAAGTYLSVRLSDGSSFIAPGTDYTHDAALTIATSAGPLQMGRASDSAPTNVSAVDDAVAAWYLRNGSGVTNLAAGSTLITATSTSLNTNVTNSTLAVTESGTWTVQPGNTANTTAWLVAGGKTNNNAAPGATNFGVLPALANASAPTWTEGNLVALSADLAGALRVAGSISCSNCTGSGASKVDDGAFGVATDSVAPAGGMFDDVAPDSVNEGDVGIVRMSGNRNMYVQLRDNAGNERGLNIDASGNIAVTQSGTWNVGTVTTVTAVTAISNALPAGNNNIGDIDVVGGTVAHDGAASAINPLLVGAYASQAAPSDVSADNDSVRLWALRNGSLVANLAAGGTLITSTGANLNVQCANCSGSGASAVDDAAFVIATGSVAPAGYLFDNVAPDSVDEGDVGLARMSANRNVFVTLRDAAGNERGLNIDASNKIGVTSDLTLINGNAVNTTNGVNGSGTQRVTIASDSTGVLASITSSVVAGTGATHLGKAEDAAHTTGDTGVFALGRRIDTLAASSGSSGDYESFNMAADGALYTADVGATNGGGSFSAVASAASTNATNVKASAGQIYGIYVVNTTATLYYLRLYNLSSAPTCSSATGYIATIPIPASTTGAGIAMPINIGAAFGTGIGYCLTGGASSTDNTNAATGIYGTILYK